PQFKIILVAREPVYFEIYNIMKDVRYSNLFNFYEEHLIDLNDISAEDFDVHSLVNCHSLENIESLIALAEKNIGELDFIINSADLILAEQFDCSKIDNLLLNEIFEELWGQLISASMEEYGGKKSKIRTILIMLVFRKSRKKSEIKKDLSAKLLKLGIVKIKNSSLEIESTIFTNWILVNKWYKVRTEVQLQRDLRKIYTFYDNVYNQVIELILESGFEFNKWFVDLLFEENYQTNVKFEQKSITISKLLLLSSNFTN
ncbi:unnamed protein product, partial [marine sediment metagenome]